MSAIALSCLQVPSSPIKFALTAVIVTAMLVSISQLDIFYDRASGKLRDFGTAPHETLFPGWLAMLAAGYTIYIMSASISAFGACKG
jgi:hypothetical protein